MLPRGRGRAVRVGAVRSGGHLLAFVRLLNAIRVDRADLRHRLVGSWAPICADMGGSGLTGLDIGQMMSARDSPLVEGGHGRRILDYRTRSVRCALPVPQAEERRHEVARLFGRSPNELSRHDDPLTSQPIWAGLWAGVMLWSLPIAAPVSPQASPPTPPHSHPRSRPASRIQRPPDPGLQRSRWTFVSHRTLPRRE
jgi:hypothetical protein